MNSQQLKLSNQKSSDISTNIKFIQTQLLQDLQKMKKNYISDLRYCEKIKESQTFMSIDGLQKKVRKKFKINTAIPFDAEKMQRQIMCFWKEGWQYEHFHPVFLNPKVYYPIVTMADPQQQTNQQLKKYAEMIQRLIERLRIDQQIEVNYKIEPRRYIENWEDVHKYDKNWKYHRVAQVSTKNLFHCLSKATGQMIKDVQQSSNSIDQVQFLDTEESNKIVQIQNQLRFISRIFNRHIINSNNSQQIQEQISEKYGQQTRNLNTFVANVISILDEMKEEKRGPSFVSVQPKIGQLTYIIHPVLCAINALFYKQKIQRQKVKRVIRQFEQSLMYDENQCNTAKELDQKEQKKNIQQFKIWKNISLEQDYLFPIKDNLKQQNQMHSRIVFVNLDGYQSQYNLQVARNFHQNLMYISFPKFSTIDQKQINTFEERFYKKIMFQKTRLGEQFTQNQQLKNYYLQQKLTKNPENYHDNIEKLYQQNQQSPEHSQSSKIKDPILKIIDRNQRIYIFPISMNQFLHNHQQDFPEYYKAKDSKPSMYEHGYMNNKITEDENMSDIIQNYESYFIRFLMRRYIFQQIQRFGPTHIIVSYSNRISLEDSHFVEMIQEFTKLGSSKVMMFPNFTTSFVKALTIQEKQEDQQKGEDEFQYLNCYAITNARIVMNNRVAYRDHGQNSDCFDQCPLTLSFFSKILRFLKISSGTYNLQQNFQNQSLSSKLKNIKVYPYIQFLFNVLSEEYNHLTNKIDKDMLKADKFFLEQRLYEQNQELIKCIPLLYRNLFLYLQNLIVKGQESPYVDDVYRVLESIFNDTNAQRIDRIRKNKIEDIERPFNQFKVNEQRQKMDNKFQQKVHIYFKTRQQKTQYEDANQQKINIKTRPGLHLITFSIDKQHILPIYKDTSIIYQANQLNKYEAYILIMNHLGLNEKLVKNYICKVKLNTKNSFESQNIIVKPLCLMDGNNKSIENELFKAKCQWNFKETQNYLILYWPSEYDFVKASLFKMAKQQYEPRICDEIYISRKISLENQYTHFNQVRIIIDSPIIPRRGCSAYSLGDKIFIFGGVYQRQFNYLQQQNDIVTIDLTDQQDSLKIKQESKMMEESAPQKVLEQQKSKKIKPIDQVILVNVKNQLYSKQYFDSVVSDNSKTKRINSFIRPKIQIQFYDFQDICNEPMDNQAVKTVIMIGGYGQNFLFPHSLLTYFYHVVKFNREDRSIISIEKKNTVQKPVPINLKQPIKNKHIFQNFNIHENDVMARGYTKESHYFFHRVAFYLGKMDNKNKDPNLDNYLDLNYKFLFLYATQMYNQVEKGYLRFAEKIGQKRIIEQSEDSKVQIINGCNNNLFITSEEGSFLYSLNYRQEIGKKVIPLTNESIISLDTNNNIVCALIKHKEHTSDKCVLAAQKVQAPNPKYAYLNELHYIDLLLFKQLDSNYQLSVLFMMKRNELILVHGNSFAQYQIHDKIISPKYSKAESFGSIVQQKSPEIQPPQISLKDFYDCTSFFIRMNQKLVAINFMTHNSKQLQFVYAFDRNNIEMNAQKKQWVNQIPSKFLSFYIKQEDQEVFLGKIRFIEVMKKSNTQNYCIISALTPIMFNNKKYCFLIENIKNEPTLIFKQMVISKVKVHELTENEKWMNVSWKKNYKNQQKYKDSNIPLNIS